MGKIYMEVNKNYCKYVKEYMEESKLTDFPKNSFPYRIENMTKRFLEQINRRREHY